MRLFENNICYLVLVYHDDDDQLSIMPRECHPAPSTGTGMVT